MPMPSGFTGKVGIIQRVLAFYRRPFFDKLADSPGISVSVFAGQPMRHEALDSAKDLEIAQLYPGRNRYLPGPSGFVCWQSGLKRWLKEFDPDVLITDANPRLFSTWLALRHMRRKNRPVIGWGLGALERSGPTLISKLRGLGADSVLRRLDGMVAYSSKAAQDYIKAGASPDRVFTAYNAIDNEESEHYLAELTSETSWIDPWKESLRLGPELPIVLFVGRLIPPKRVDMLIEACAPLFEKCQLLIVGDGPLRAELEAQAQPYGSRVYFAGHHTGVTLAQCFIASDVFVLPGSGGLAVHQAMSYGKPIIVSFGDGTEADLVRQDVNGLFVSLGNVTELRQGISNLITKPQLINQMGEASLRIVREEMGLDAMVASFNRALAEVTNGH